MSQTPGWADVLERLAHLEKQNRRMKQIGAVVLIVAASVLWMGQAAPTNQTLEAREFVLKDESGHRRAWLGIRADAPGLLLYDASGEKVRAFLGVAADGPGLHLADAEGKVRASLSVKQDQPGLVVSDKEGFTTQIGHAELLSSNPGESKETSAAAVVLTGKSQTLIWTAH